MPFLYLFAVLMTSHSPTPLLLTHSSNTLSYIVIVAAKQARKNKPLRK